METTAAQYVRNADADAKQDALTPALEPALEQLADLADRLNASADYLAVRLKAVLRPARSEEPTRAATLIDADCAPLVLTLRELEAKLTQAHAKLCALAAALDL